MAAQTPGDSTPTNGLTDRLREHERLLFEQTLRTRDAVDRLDAQRDPRLREALVEEWRIQEDLRSGLARSVASLREEALADWRASQARIFFEGLAAARVRRVEGDERRALLAGVRQKLSRRE